LAWVQGACFFSIFQTEISKWTKKKCPFSKIPMNFFKSKRAPLTPDWYALKRVFLKKFCDDKKKLKNVQCKKWDFLRSKFEHFCPIFKRKKSHFFKIE
tara:strand:- start:1140 stop:1433 length:294 start_codon:yes stop_codon:yes gene_type:complete